MKIMPPARAMLAIVSLLSIVVCIVYAYDPEPLQDSVNDSKAGSAFVNGRFCKDPKTVTSDDFFFSGLNKAGNITSPLGTKATRVSVDQLPGLNTLGLFVVRVDFAPNGVNPPHQHPRASEFLLVLEGTLYAGFISSNPSNSNDKNKLYTKTLHPGYIFLFPKGLVHFQYNIGEKNAVAISILNSQNPGIVFISNAIFGSEPTVLPDLLTTTFQLDKETVNRLQSLPWIGNT